MADLLEQASAWLAAQRKQFLSRPVVYSRGADSVQVAVTVGQTEFEVQGADNVVEKWQSRDFLVTAADLVLSGVQVVPERGDRITDGDKVYEVLSPANEDVYRLSDPYGVTLRIHTKQVE